MIYFSAYCCKLLEDELLEESVDVEELLDEMLLVELLDKLLLEDRL